MTAARVEPRLDGGEVWLGDTLIGRYRKDPEGFYRCTYTGGVYGGMTRWGSPFEAKTAIVDIWNRRQADALQAAS